MPTTIKASQQWLSLREQEALVLACATFINSLFDDYPLVDVWNPETIVLTRLGKHLPKIYSEKYTPFLFKQFGVCVISLAWKLVHSKPLPPASVAEQLAGWAILQEAKEILKQESRGEENDAPAFQALLPRWFPDRTFLLLFEPAETGRHRHPAVEHTSLAFENWFSPFPDRRQGLHPYAGGEEFVGRAYRRCLTEWEHFTLAKAIMVLIDEMFDDLVLMEKNESEQIALTTLSWHLPVQYSSHYTPLFVKQFIVCILTVAWKLTQPKQIALSSVAEELAAWAILTAAKTQMELDSEGEEQEGGEQAAAYAFENMIDEVFEDTDFLFLFERQYSGIHASPVGQLLGMTSLAFEDWMKPFTNAPERRAHPYVWRA